MRPAVGENPVVLSCVRLVATERLSIHATNLDLAVAWQVPATVESPGEAVIPARLLRDLVDANDGEQLEISMAGQHLLIRIGETRGSLATHNGLDWPAPPPVPAGTAVQLGPEDFARIVTVSHAASLDATQGALAAVALTRESATATDGYRIAIAELGSPVPDAMIPAGVVHMLARLGPTSWTVSADDRRVRFDSPDCSWTSTMLTGALPDCLKIVNEATGAGFISVKRGDLLAALQRVAVFQRTTRVRLGAHGAGIEVQCEEVDRGLLQEPVPAQGGLPFPVLLRRDYLHQALSTFRAPEVRMHYSAQGKPVVFRADGIELLIHPIKEEDTRPGDSAALRP